MKGRRTNSFTERLGCLILRRFLASGMTDIELDDLREAFVQEYPDEGRATVARHLDSAREFLRLQHGWWSEKATRYYFDRWGHGSGEPETDPDLKLCVPGLAGPTAGVHFFRAAPDATDSEASDLLFIMARVLRIDSAVGKVARNAKLAVGAKELGLLTGLEVRRIARLGTSRGVHIEATWRVGIKDLSPGPATPAVSASQQTAPHEGVA